MKHPALTEIKPQPEPGWSPSLWPARRMMSLEWVCFQARLNSWKQLIGYLIASLAFVGLSIFCLLSVLRPHIHHRYDVYGWVSGIFCPPLFTFTALYVIAVMIAKLITQLRSGADPDLSKIERLLPVPRKNPD
jgi:hypothetical protein